MRVGAHPLASSSRRTSSDRSHLRRSLDSMLPRRFSKSLGPESFGSFVLEQGSLSWEISRQKNRTIDPDTMGISLWNACLLVVVSYDLWVIPLLLCFDKINPDMCTETWLTVILMVFEVFFVADIYVQLHTGYYIAGDLVRNPASTRRRYTSSWHFPLDLLALVPLPLFPLASNQVCGLILVNKLLRLRRIPAYTLDFDKVFARYFKFCKFVKVVAVSFVFCHLMACLYVAFGKAHTAHGDDAASQDDVWKIHDGTHAGHYQLLTEYFAAHFWSLGLVSKCVEGEIPGTLLQTLFTLVVMLGGFLLFVYICGTLFMISKCDANSIERFDAKINQLRYVLSFHHVPADMQERAVEFLENGFKSGEANDRNTMRLLCPSIAKDVKYTLLKATVSSVPFFKCCNAAFIRALIDLMETSSLPTNYIVCSKGEQGEDMFFVQSGVLAVLINDIKVRELRKGGFFGELSLFTNQVRTANVATATFCILHKLSRSHVRRVLRAYPQFETQILDCVKSLLEEMDMENTAAARRFSSMKAETVAKRAQAYGNYVKQDGESDKSTTTLASNILMDVLPQANDSHTLAPVDPLVVNIIASMGGTPWTRLLRLIKKHADSNTWKRVLLQRAINRKARLRLTWLLCVMTATLYNVFTAPLLNAFQLIGYPLSALLLNSFADAILVLDIYFKFNLSFVDEGEQILDTVKCARHYFHSSFPFDLVCAFPWWIFYPSLHLKLRFIRMLRFYRLNDELEELALFVRINSRRRIVVLGIGLVLCYHIAGCMAHALTLVIGYGESKDGWLPPNTLHLAKVYDNVTGELVGYDWMEGQRFVPLDDPFVNDIILLQFTRAIQYGAVCLTNLGRTLEPEELGEFILAFVLMLSGMLLISFIIDEVQKRVTASAIEQMEFLSTRSRILHFLQKQKAPLEMHRRVSSYLDFWWSAHRGANINELLSELPKSMQREIYGFICSDILDVIIRMDHIGDKFDQVSSLVLDNLVIHLYGQGETLYRRGDYAEAVFILLAGDCVVSQSGKTSTSMPVQHIKHGEFFGCSSLHVNIENNVHNDLAIARSACVVGMVSRPTLVLLNQAFPAFSESILRREIKRYGEHRAMSKLLDPNELLSLTKNFKKGGMFVVNPDSNFSVVWETLLFFGMVFQTIGVPYYMAFGFTVQGVGPSDGLSILLETCFLADIFLKTRTGYLSYGNKVMDIKKIRKRYLHSFGFLIDVLAVVPLNLVNISRIKRSEAWNMNKLLRLFKLSSQIENLERHYFTINIQIRIFKLVFYIYLLAHYVGCTWYNFASNASTIFGFIEDTQFGHDPWLPPKDMDLANHEISSMIKYSKALFWGLGMLLGFDPGEFPETPLEYIFTMVIQTIGVFLLAYVVGNLLDIVQVMEGNNRLFYSNLNYVRKLTKYFEFTDDVKLKIQHFYFYRLFHSIHEEHVLIQCLPPSLVADIRLFLLTPMLKKVPFFQDETASSNVTRSLVRQLSQILVTRGEVVCRQREVGVEMYFIFTGCLDVFVASEHHVHLDDLDQPVAHKGMKVNELHAGSFFGEKSLFSDQPRNASIEARTFCTLYKLSRMHLESVFAQHPEWKAKVMQIVNVIYEKQQLQIIQQDKDKEKDVSDHQAKLVASRHTAQEVATAGKTTTGRVPWMTRRASSLKTITSNYSVLSWGQKAKKQLMLIEVQSPFYRSYLTVLCFALLYVALSVPYFVTFGHASKTSTITIIITILDVVTDIVFGYDMYFKRHLVETVASREFYEHRLHHDSTGVFLDVLTILPVDYAFSFTEYNAVLRFNRFIKLRQLTHTINEIHRFSMSYEVNRLKLLALYYFIIGYWTACAYFSITFVDGFGPTWDSSLPVEYFNSSNHMGGYDMSFALFQFLRCLYFSSTMYTGVGIVYEPDTLLQFAFIFIMSVFGVFVIGYVIGEASTLSIYLIQNEVEFMINQMNVMEFLARKRMDRGLQTRVHIYLSYWWSTQQGVAYQTILEQLPHRIRSQAYIQMARMSLARFSMRYIRPLCDETMGVDHVMHSVASRLVFEGYPAGESVIVQGNIGQTMYFVSKGNLITASTAADFMPTRFVDGQFFGEEGFLAASFCRHSVVTLRACDLLALSSTDFLMALNEHPRFAECCAIAWDTVANHHITLHDLYGASDVGDFVYNSLTRMQPHVLNVRPTTIDRAEVMFRHFLRLFVRQLPDESAESGIHDGFEIECQHCEDSPATLYCKLCLQGLCESCSKHIHENTHFAFHLATITRLRVYKDPPPPPPEPTRFNIKRIVRTWQVLHPSSNHVIPMGATDGSLAPPIEALDNTHSISHMRKVGAKSTKRVIRVSQEMLSGSLKHASKPLEKADSRRGSRKQSMHKNVPPVSPERVKADTEMQELKRNVLPESSGDASRCQSIEIKPVVQPCVGRSVLTHVTEAPAQAASPPPAAPRAAEVSSPTEETTSDVTAARDNSDRPGPSESYLNGAVSIPHDEAPRGQREGDHQRLCDECQTDGIDSTHPKDDAPSIEH
ncbi:Aste57867_22657 [Aphanomyces stellatus]|uniref:Aste57867_22657 protein n=1 Tax=Aphanomyces stellatus TaxID=120398 RepID=A0A485LKL0_9STRA|nr:hypothetical protein As57867_022587 [Aphanomyces stellatus]VFT99311.1 Aste57867_22657 [Aphanomyces stellatus]